MEPKIHIPVMLREVIGALNLKKSGRYIDCTVGTGGHASTILENILPGGHLLGIDADSEAIAAARIRLARFGDALMLVNSNFASLENIALNNYFYPVDGILFDLGLSSLQLDSNHRGFSFQKDSPLDMRFDQRHELSADHLVNKAAEDELYKIIHDYGEEPAAHRIAKSIIANRPITGTLHLAQVIEKATGGFRGRIHPATRTFQALRIAVNNELENLERALHQASSLLDKGGRLVVISYHSLEDRIVKKYFFQETRGCLCPPSLLKCVCQHIPSLKIINKKIIRPKLEEVLFNPRSRSARLRLAERL